MARAEIARRLIALDERESGRQAVHPAKSAALVTAVLAIILVPVLTIAGYRVLGSPGKTDMPLLARKNADPSKLSVDELVARAEVRVKENPDELRGWAVLGPVYMRLGRINEAVNAYRNIVRIAGGHPDYEAALAEALTIAAGGKVTDEAKRRFQSAATADPEAVKPRIYLAIAFEQAGEYDQSIDAWNALIARRHQMHPGLPRPAKNWNG